MTWRDRYRASHLEFSCQFYGFEVKAHGAAVHEALFQVEAHRQVCPYCKGEKVPATPFEIAPPSGGETR